MLTSKLNFHLTYYALVWVLTSNTIWRKCGSDLLVREVKQGGQKGSQFLGCSSYPRCRFTKEIKQESGGSSTFTIIVNLIVIGIICWVLNWYGFLTVLFIGWCNHPLSQTHPQRYMGNDCRWGSYLWSDHCSSNYARFYPMRVRTKDYYVCNDAKQVLYRSRYDDLKGLGVSWWEVSDGR